MENKVEVKHTPGPWLVHDSTYVTTNDTNVVIANARGWNSFALTSALQQMEANAKLIAAAPELLEALTNALPVLSEYSSKLYFEAKEAITKATS